MNEKDTTSQGEVEIPGQLLPALRAAAVLGVELACEGEWEDGQLGRVEAAVHVRDALAAGSCTHEQVSVLASRAAAMQGDVCAIGRRGERRELAGDHARGLAGDGRAGGGSLQAGTVDEIPD